MRHRSVRTRIGSILLTGAMLLSLLPMSALAVEEPEQDTVAIVQTADGQETGYETLNKAMQAAVAGSIVVLQQDVTVTNKSATKNFGVTVDLNGYNIYGEALSATTPALELGTDYGSKPVEGVNSTICLINSKAPEGGTVTAKLPVRFKAGDSNKPVPGVIGDGVNLIVSEGGVTAVELKSSAYLLYSETTAKYISNGGFRVSADGQDRIYGTYANATKVAAGNTITMLNDYTGSTPLYSGNATSTLDLNDKTYTYTGPERIAEINYDNAGLTLMNGTLKCEQSGIDGIHMLYSNTSLTLDNVTLDASGSYGIVTNGEEVNNSITLKDSALTAENGSGIYFPSTGSVTIENSKVSAENVGVQMCAGSLAVKGEQTTITATGTPQGKTENDGVIPDAAAVSIVERNGYQDLGTVAIEAGTFEATESSKAVKAYAFNNTDKTEEEWAGASEVITITGGTFSTDVSAYVADGYICEKSGNNYVVSKLNADNSVARVGDEYYQTLAEAVEAVVTSESKSGTVTLLKNAQGGGIGLFRDNGATDVDLTIDFGGYIYTCNDPAVGSAGTESQGFHLEKGNTVTLKNGTIQVADNSTGTGMLIQNYCDLTLEDLTLKGSDVTRYIISSNYGDMSLTNVNISGTHDNLVAIDLMHWLGTSYAGKAPTMTIDNTAKNTISGSIDVYCWEDSAEKDDCEDKPILTIYGGTFSTDDVKDYCATGYEAVPNNPEAPTLWIVEAKTGMEASTEQAGTTSSATVGGNFAPNQSAESNPAEDEGTVDTTSPVLSINVTTGSDGQPAEDVTESNVTINSEALTSVAAQSEVTVSDVKITTDVGTVTLDKAAWDSIADNAKGGSVTLTIQEDENSTLGWSVTATDEDGEPVFSTENERDGEITISVPCTKTVQESEKLVVYYIGEDGQLESMVTTYEQGTLSWVTDHLSNFGGVTIGQDDEAVWVFGSTLKAGKLSEALDELDSTGGTIDLIRNATLDAARYTISGNVVIQKSANPLQESELTITTTVATGVGTGAFYISPDASLTLDGVKMSLMGTEDTEGVDGQYDGTGFILSNAKSGTGGKLILNDAEVELTGFQRGFVFEVSASNLGSVELTNSKLTIQNIDGNASNGGIWTIKENSTVTVSNCGDNGLSAEVVNVDGSSVTVENTGLVGMLASQINLDNGAEVTVTGSGQELPFISTWAPNGKQYENAVEVKKGGTLSVDSTSSVTLRDNQNQSGTSTNTILVAEGTLDNQGTIVADEIKTTAPTGYSTVTVMDGNKTLAVATIKNNEKYTLPDVLSRSGYTFLGWSDGQRTHDAKDNVTISANTTFQAVWSYNGSTSSGGSSGVTRYNVTVEDTDNGSIRVSPSRASRGQTVTITVDPDEGYVLDRLIVRDSDGDRIDLERKSATKYTFEMPRGKVTVEATFVEGEEENVLPFRDVDVDDWFYDAVVYAYENDLMSGVSAREFAPNSTLTRAMVAQMLWAMEGKPQVNYLMQYADVGSGDWYAEAVRWASSQGIMSGYGDSQFGPNDPVTRQQLALILYNYAKEKDYDTTGGGMALREYSDYDAIADWAVTGLGWAVEHGLISGMGDGVLAPTGGATRAQVAQIFMNFCEDVAE